MIVQKENLLIFLFSMSCKFSVVRDDLDLRVVERDLFARPKIN